MAITRCTIADPRLDWCVGAEFLMLWDAARHGERWLAECLWNVWDRIEYGGEQPFTDAFVVHHINSSRGGPTDRDARRFALRSLNTPIDFSAHPSAWRSVQKSQHHDMASWSTTYSVLTMATEGDRYLLHLVRSWHDDWEDREDEVTPLNPRPEDIWYAVEVPQCGFRAEYARAVNQVYPFDPCWRTDAVMGLAQRAAERREPELLPILADALEDAGCDDRPLLHHCRGSGPHSHRCWVLDAVLGLERLHTGGRRPARGRPPDRSTFPELVRGPVEEAWERCLPIWLVRGRVEDYPRDEFFDEDGHERAHGWSAGYELGYKFARAHAYEWEFVGRRLASAHPDEAACAFDVLRGMMYQADVLSDWDYEMENRLKALQFPVPIPDWVRAEIAGCQNMYGQFTGSTLGELLRHEQEKNLLLRDQSR